MPMKKHKPVTSRLFHDNPDVMVLVANPAAAAEGISLHSVCHRASTLIAPSMPRITCSRKIAYTV
ncbi:MAG TPA: hypothetical protein VIX91_09285 [Candidatus Acidoferrum sp.]